MAEEMAKFTRDQIMMEASTAMLAQAKSEFYVSDEVVRLSFFDFNSVRKGFPEEFPGKPFH